ncbi:MAG TPA: uroporphyrinogen decarboxylase family protein [bacterium]|nr:uroporphyrinogen decarboxylase family protein [bacterium]HPM98622.1 uroporphyrinogen decarboxylase family protein [bacterium]
MNTTARFRAALHFKPVDRLPVVEWAPWWDETIERWYGEGLPRLLKTVAEIQDYFELDPLWQCWISPYKKEAPEVPKHCPGFIENRQDYLDFKKKYLFPHPAFDYESLAGWPQKHQAGEITIWLTLNGFYWFPREIFGVERQLYAFYDQPELMNEINQDLLEFNLRALQEFNTICKADFMTIAEDMSYRSGPMLSENAFDQVLLPAYRQLIPELKKAGMVAMMDTDGNVMPMMSWLEKAAFEGTLPLERMAGNDLQVIRQQHPNSVLIGGFNKMVMNKGEEAMRAEFENLYPVMTQGGYIPGVDHQTPPQVSLQEYRLFLSLLREYCNRAGKEMQLK